MSNNSKSGNFDFLTAVVVIISGIIYGIATYLLPRAAVGDPISPLYFPGILSAGLIVFGILLLIRSDLSETKKALAALINLSEKDKKNAKQIALATVICIFYSIIFEHAGFVISTIIFLELLLLITNRKRYVQNTIVSILFSVAIYVLFSKILGITLPPLPILGI